MKKKILSLLLSLAVSVQCISFTVNAENGTDSPDNIRTIAIDFSDDNVAEIELYEGEQVQLVILDDSDMPEIDYVAFNSSYSKTAVSHDLKLTGCCAGKDSLHIYLGYKDIDYERQINFYVNVRPNENISAENRAELERINNLGYDGDDYLRRKMELVGALDKEAPRLDMDKVQEIINSSVDVLDIYRQFNEYHSYPDLMPYRSNTTRYYYWFDKKGSELVYYVLEYGTVVYEKIADDGTVIGVQELYPEKTEFFPNGKDKSYEYIQYNQIRPDGYGTLNLKFIDSSTGEAFTETNGKFQLISDDEVIKSWDASESKDITIGNLSLNCTYEIRYIDDYHGDFSYNQQYKYEIDHDKGSCLFSFGYDSELSYNIYLKKRHRGDPYLLGDVNSDNMFNIADVVTLQKWLLGKPDTVLMNWKAADLCKDDVLDVFDLCLMKKSLIENS